MAVTYQSFTTAYPAFNNTTAFPQATVQFWIDQAATLVNADRFGAQTDFATMLFVAHNLVVAGQAAASGGGTTGIVSSKSVGPVSKSYDTSASLVAGAENYNATPYGQQYYRLLRAVCSGPVYVPSRRAATGNGAWPFGGYIGLR